MILYDNDFSYIIMILANFQAGRVFNCARLSSAIIFQGMF